MGRRMLEDLRMTGTSRGYVDAMHGILAHCGWTSFSKPELSGMSVSAFRFNVNRRLTAESPTAYNWIAENFLAADFLGFTTSQQAGFSFDPTFPLYRKHAIVALKQSIDRGIGAVIWKDGFAVAVGYDDGEETLYYRDGSTTNHARGLHYGEFGCNRDPYWYYQVFEDQVELDLAEVYKESLVQAVFKWETHDRMLPESRYACGQAAYGAIIDALRSGDYDREGAAHTIGCYRASKRDIASYVLTLSQYRQEYGELVRPYAELARIFEESEALYMEGKAADVIPLLRRAERTEGEAVAAIRAILRETLANRFEDIGLR